MNNLNGTWDFVFNKNSDKLPESFTSLATVPGCFDSSGQYAGKRGVGFYRKHINLEKDTKYLLTLEGVAHNSKVYLNRKLIAEHHGAFTAFSVDIIPEKAGQHELIVIADNRFDDLNRPLHLPYFDWYSYGGIIRPVTLEKWNSVLIESINPVITDWKKGKAKLNIYCRFDKKTALPLHAKISLNGNIVASKEITNDSPIQIDINIPDSKPWTPENPNLYKLQVNIADAEKNINLGFREIKTIKNQIFLNDKPIRLRGINRHDCSVQFGFANPPALNLYDVEKIKELGCNFVRTSHYPPSQDFMDLCDKMGLLVWCEATGWQYNIEMIKDQRLLKAQKLCITEMIRQYSHHPSIICWGILNECDSSTLEAKPFYEELITLIRKLDPTRAVTYATNVNAPKESYEETQIKDCMLDLVDWISLNIYPGWYTGDTSNCNDMLGFMAKRFEQSEYNKPIIISEIGAGAIQGFEHYHPVKWSLSYQSQLMETMMDYIRQNKTFNGVIIWQYSDILTAEHRVITRPKQHNNKGLVDAFRRPKPAFETVKKIFKMDW